jgi:hypothetical protein
VSIREKRVSTSHRNHLNGITDRNARRNIIIFEYKSLRVATSEKVFDLFMKW